MRQGETRRQVRGQALVTGQPETQVTATVMDRRPVCRRRYRHTGRRPALGRRSASASQLAAALTTFACAEIEVEYCTEAPRIPETTSSFMQVTDRQSTDGKAQTQDCRYDPQLWGQLRGHKCAGNHGRIRPTTAAKDWLKRLSNTSVNAIANDLLTRYSSRR